MTHVTWLSVVGPPTVVFHAGWVAAVRLSRVSASTPWTLLLGSRMRCPRMYLWLDSHAAVTNLQKY